MLYLEERMDAMLIMPDDFASHPNVYPRLRGTDGRFWRRNPISYSPFIDNRSNWAKECDLVTATTLEGIALRALITAHLTADAIQKFEAVQTFKNLCLIYGDRWGVTY